MQYRRSFAIGIHLLITSQITYSLVLLTANIDDVKKLARQFVSAPLADQIANFIAQATVIKPKDISAENARNSHVHRPSGNEWNKAEKGERTSYDELHAVADDKNQFSIHRGVPIRNIRKDKEIKRDPTLNRPPLVERTKYFKYDFALKQDNAKEPQFEWKKAVNFGFVAESDSATDTFNPYTFDNIQDTTMPTLDATPTVKKAKKHKQVTKKTEKHDILLSQDNGEVKTTKKRQRSVRVDKRKPPKHRQEKEERAFTTKKYSRPENVQAKKTIKPQSEEEYILVSKKHYKPETIDINPKKIETKEVKVNESSEKSSEIEDVNISNIEIVGSTKFDNYYDRAVTKKSNEDTMGKEILFDGIEGSIYTKENVLATSGPVALLKDAVHMTDSSGEKSLNDENGKYFKQYDIGAGSSTDLRKHYSQATEKKKNDWYGQDNNKID